MGPFNAFTMCFLLVIICLAECHNPNALKFYATEAAFHETVQSVSTEITERGSHKILQRSVLLSEDCLIQCGSLLQL